MADDGSGIYHRVFRIKDRSFYFSHFTACLRMRRVMRSRSFSVNWVPEGRHRPRLNRSSATAPPTSLAGYWVWFIFFCLNPPTLRPATRNTGCRCMGFQIGRASMFSASRARRVPFSKGNSALSVSIRDIRAKKILQSLPKRA